MLHGVNNSIKYVGCMSQNLRTIHSLSLSLFNAFILADEEIELLVLMRD